MQAGRVSDRGAHGREGQHEGIYVGKVGFEMRHSEQVYLHRRRLGSGLRFSRASTPCCVRGNGASRLVMEEEASG